MQIKVGYVFYTKPRHEKRLSERLTYGGWRVSFMNVIANLCEKMDADALARITEWTEFRVPNWDKVGVAMKTRVVFEGRDLHREIVGETEFDYYGVGMK